MTIQRTLAAGGLSSLTSLNARLVAQAVTTTEEEAAESENEILNVGGARPDDPEGDDDAAERVEVRGRFVSEDPFEYNRIKEWIETNVFGGTSQGQAGLINAFVNEWDIEYRRRQGLGPEDQIGDGATLERLLAEEEFVNGAAWLPVTGIGGLPPVFTSEVEPGPAGEEGEPGEPEDAEAAAPAAEQVIGVANPLTGVTFHTVTEIAAAETPTTKQARTDILIRQPTSDLARDVVRAQIKQKAAAGAGPRTIDVGGMTLGQALRTGAPRRPEQEIPFISAEDIAATYEASRADTSTGSRGRRGSGTRRTIQFDKAHLTAQTAELYNRWMLQPGEAPESIVSGIVNRYIREARSLWAGKGVQKDFDTFVRQELKKLPRYETIYEHKLPDQSEEEFIGSFRQPIERLGLRNELTQRQTEAAVTSGGGPADQFRRVSRSREAQVANAGDLSQRLARTLQGVGVG